MSRLLFIRFASFFIAVNGWLCPFVMVQATNDAESHIEESTNSKLSEQLNALIDEIWEWEIAENPWLATEVGRSEGQERLPSDTLADLQRRHSQEESYLQRLAAFDPESLSVNDRINQEVMRLRLKNSIANYRFGACYMPISGREGFHLSFAQLADSMKLEHEADFENYIARLNDFPRYVREQIKLMMKGIEKGYTIPAVVLRETPSQIEPHIVGDAMASELYKPFKKPKPASIGTNRWTELQEQARKAIEQSVVPAYRDFHDFVKDIYLPSSRSSIAARALPNGREYYQDRIEHFTTLPLTAQEIHYVGLIEVQRIRQSMQIVMSEIGFEGSLSAFVEKLQRDESQYAKAPEELMQFVALILKRIDGALPQIFSKLPRTPYGLKEIPAYVAPQTTSAYYFPPAGDGTRAGYFYLNTYNLSQRPKFEMEALSLHEAVPGHHLQIALQQEMQGVHPVRRFAMFTAYVEGWGLYAEQLGDELGLYQDPYQRFGQLSFEAWRACRLVVDTGIHDMGWTREQAIAYMRENTALSDHNIAAEVDRYIGWPGQALGYKIGQLKISALRQEAEQQLGDRFDLRAFHEVVLGQGAVPLTILEQQVKEWIRKLLE